MFVELHLEGVLDILFKMVDFGPQGLALVQRKGLDFGFQFGDAVFVGLDGGMDVGAHICHALAQLVV